MNVRTSPERFPQRVKLSFLPYLLLDILEKEPTSLYHVRMLLKSNYQLSINLSLLHAHLKRLVKQGLLSLELDPNDYHHFRRKIYYVTIQGSITKRTMHVSVVEFLRTLIYKPKIPQ